jgi:hypothetical protein
VSRACRYDSDLNPTYQQMAMHYPANMPPLSSSKLTLTPLAFTGENFLRLP